MLTLHSGGVLVGGGGLGVVRELRRLGRTAKPDNELVVGGRERAVVVWREARWCWWW